MLLSMVSAAVAGAVLLSLPFLLWPLAQKVADFFIDDVEGWKHWAHHFLTLACFLSFFPATALTIPNVVLSPLQDPISEATETACGAFNPPPFAVKAMLKGIAASLIHTGLRLTFMLLGLLVLAPLNFIPGVGSFLWWLLSSLWTMFWLSAEYLSGPMSRHLYRFSEVVRALRKRLPLAMGFGGGLFILLWVPVLNFFLMPVAVVAATLLFTALRTVQAVPASSVTKL